MHTLYSDGGSRGNPGNAAWAYVILNLENQVIETGAKYIGINTNNFAEYTGLIEGLLAAKALGIKELTCYLDSELVVMQVNGAYKVKQDTLKVLHTKIMELKPAFSKLNFLHVPRSENKVADSLVNLALDQAT